MHDQPRNSLLRRPVIAAFLCVTALAAGASAVFGAGPGDPGAGSGAGDDAAFLRRVSDRNLRAEYQQRFHVVVRDEDFDGVEVQPPPPATQPSASEGDTPRVNENTGSGPPSTPMDDRGHVIWIIVGLTLPCGFVVAALLRYRDRHTETSQGAMTGKQKQNRKRTGRT